MNAVKFAAEAQAAATKVQLAPELFAPPVSDLYVNPVIVKRGNTNTCSFLSYTTTKAPTGGREM